MQSIEKPGRREFLSQGSKMLAACALIGSAPIMANAASSQDVKSSSTTVDKLTDKHYYLDNVLLETGFTYEDKTVVATQTALHTLEIKEGKIAAIVANKRHADAALPVYDAGGKLMLPAFRDMHIHLDKTFYGGAWLAPKSREGKTIMDMITLEQTLLPQLQSYTRERANKLIDLIQSYGSVIARSHCNVEPTSGLKNLEALQEVMQQRKDDFSFEIVAFPQHGLLHSKSEALMRDAMKAGAHYVGGLDPTNVDKDMKKSLDTMFQIALDYDKGVDIHLHETSPAGVAALNYMIDTVEKTPSLKGKLTISHAFALAVLSKEEAEATAKRLADNKITIASTVPIGPMHMPLKTLRNAGVSVITGTDSVVDHWSPFGKGDMLEKSNLYAQLYTRPDEFTLSRSLWLATGNVLPLNDNGEQVWPKVQDDASFVLVDASCSAEAVARVSPRYATFHKGQMASGKVNKQMA